MPTVIVNDESMEYETGERLLAVARRNAAHIGFVCDGRAICQTCRCRILEGSEHVSVPNRAERSLLPESRLEMGYRLACQVTITGAGPLSVITRAEELRRQAVRGNIPGLVGNVAGVVRDQASLFPSNVQSLAGRVTRMRLNGERLQQTLADAGRVANRMIKGKGAQTAREEQGKLSATNEE